MDTTAKIRSLAKIYIWLMVLGVTSSFFFESLLPVDLQAYITNAGNEELTTAGFFMGWVIVAILIAHFWSLYGLIVVKSSAKPLFIYSLVALYSIGLFIGPIVDHAISSTIGGLAGLVSGMIIALLMFTQSEFNDDTSSLASRNIVDA